MYNQNYYPSIAYNPYAPPPQPQKSEYVLGLENRLKELEGRYYGVNPNQNNISQDNSYNANYASPANSQAQYPQISIIPVDSAEEAWNYKDSWKLNAGEELWFKNKSTGEFYVKYYDANVPKTYRLVGKFEEMGNTNQQPTESKQGKTDSMMTAINGLSDKITDIENKIYDIKEMLENAASNNTTSASSDMEETCPDGSGGSRGIHEPSDGSGKAERARDSNGRYRANGSQ